MRTSRLRRYRHFPTVPDALALVRLLHLTTIPFETRYERGTNYGRAGHEPDRVEVWLRAVDYAYVQRLEAALTREQALALATDTLPADQLQRIVTQAAPRPPASARPGPSLAFSSASRGAGYWLLGLLLVTIWVALAFYWLG